MDHRNPDQEVPESRRNRATEYASEIGVLSVLRALMRLRGLVLLPVIARTLGPAAFGVWTQCLVVLDLGSSIIGLELHQAVVRFVSGTTDQSEQRSIFIPSLAIVFSMGVLISGLAMAFPETLSSLAFGDRQYTEIGRWLGLWVAIAGVNRLGLNLMRGLHKVKLYGFLSTGQVLFQLATVITVLLFSQELSTAIFSAIGIELLSGIVIMTLSFHAIGAGQIEWKRLRPIFRFSLPLVPGYYADLILSFADRFLIAAMLGTKAVGIYAAAYSLARLVRELYVPVSTALLPAVSRQWDRMNYKQVGWMLSNTMKYYLLLAIPAVAGIAEIGPGLLDVLASKEIGQSTTILVPFLGLGLLFSSIQQIYATVLQLAEKTSILALSKMVSATVYLVLVFIAVPRWGLLGGAAATALGYAWDMVLTGVISRQHGKFEVEFGSITKALLATTIMGFVTYAIDVPGLNGIFLQLAAGVLTYAASLYLIGGVGIRELNFLKTIFQDGLGSNL